ncbi:MAG: DUF4397 domain-containing protein [Anaerolineae bacterium]
MRKLGMMLILLALAVVPAFAQDSNGHVRAAHFAPSTGPVDMYINGELSQTGLDYTLVTDWLALPAGIYDIAVVRAGEELTSALYSVEDFALASGEWITFAAIGVPGDTSFPFVVQTIVEDYSEIGDGETRVTFFHAIPNIGAVDVRIADGTELVDSLTYPGQAASLGISTEAAANDGGATMPDMLEGAYTLQVTPVNNSEVLFQTDVEFVSGHSYLVAFVGLATEARTIVTDVDLNSMISNMVATPSGVQDLAVETCESGGTAHIRVAHFATLSRASNDVDFYLGGEAYQLGMAFADVSEWADVDSGNYDVAVTPSGSALSEALISATGAPLCADRWVTVAIIGLAQNNTLSIQPIMEDFRRLPDNTARLTVFDGVPDAPPINVQLAGGNLLIGGLTYPGQAAALGISDEPSANDGVAIRNLDVGAYDLEITRQDNANVALVSFEDLVLDRGHNYLLAVIGTLNVPTYALVSSDVPEG